jgi:hypothetical protein
VTIFDSVRILDYLIILNIDLNFNPLEHFPPIGTLIAATSFDLNHICVYRLGRISYIAEEMALCVRISADEPGSWLSWEHDRKQ